jgi:hypothetical protein
MHKFREQKHAQRGANGTHTKASNNTTPSHACEAAPR